MIPENISSLDLVLILANGMSTTVHLTANADEPPKGLEVLHATAMRMAEQMGAMIPGYIAWDVDGTGTNAFHPALDPEARPLVEAMLDELADRTDRVSEL